MKATRIALVTMGLGLVTAGVAWSGELCHLASPFLVQPLPVATDYTGNQMSADWTVDVDFDPTAPYLCHCCEYRQSLRSSVSAPADSGITIDGNPIPVDQLDPADPTGTATKPLGRTLSEDYMDYGTGPIRYGHRDEPTSADESYTDATGAEDRMNGCHYHGHDRPGISNLVAGHTYTMEIVFHGEIRCNENDPAVCGPPGPAPITEKEWIVNLAKTQ